MSCSTASQSKQRQETGVKQRGIMGVAVVIDHIHTAVNFDSSRQTMHKRVMTPLTGEQMKRTFPLYWIHRLLQVLKYSVRKQLGDMYNTSLVVLMPKSERFISEIGILT